MKVPVPDFNMIKPDIQYFKGRERTIKIKKVIDFFGYNFFNKNKNLTASDLKHTESVAIVQMGHIGDLLLSMPMICQVKKSLNKRLVLAVNEYTYDLAKHLKCVDELVVLESFRSIYLYNSKKRSFSGTVKSFKTLKADIIFEIRGDINIIVPIYLFSKYKYLFGFNVGGAGFLLDVVLDYPHHQHISKTYNRFLEFFNIPEPELQTLDFYLDYEFKNILRLDNYITVAIGAGNKSKEWEDEKFVELINSLIAQNEKVVLIGKIEPERLEKYRSISKSESVVNMLNKTTILEALSIVKFSKLFIGLDAGLTHAAAMFGVRTVALYSAMNELEIWRPYKNLADVSLIRKEVDCELCLVGCQNNICMKSIEVGDVLKVIK